MAVVAAPPSGFRPVQRVGIRVDRPKPLKRFVFAVMKDGSTTPSEAEQEEGVSGDPHAVSRFPNLELFSGQRSLASKIPKIDSSPDGSNLRFDRPQLSDDELNWQHKRAFGRYIARDALLDEELWTAAWLRAECHWENTSDVRHVETFKRQYADLEFNALKKRCGRQHAEKCICIVAVFVKLSFIGGVPRKVKDSKNVKRNLLSSIVGTLDLSIRYLLCGETFPGERMKHPASCNFYRADLPKYAYVANLCVAMLYRRQGIATNMLLLAIEAAATSYGASQLFVHVHRDNMKAQKLYDQIGFQIVREAVPHLVAENKYLLSLMI